MPIRRLIVACSLIVTAQTGLHADDEQNQHWAFRPIVRRSLPDVTQRVRVRSPIDLFIQARIEAAGLKFAPPAHRLTLIRRVTFDLTGFPPTSAKIEAFLADTAPGSWERLVDRLLATPAYGERWARHWLDVVRYADSNGLDENMAYIEAFRFRDYVINAFNNDTPFDQFIHEQLAGDLLPLPEWKGLPDRERRIRLLTLTTRRRIATGFLSLGPKGLREVDGTKMELDIIDDQVTTLGNAFLALTLQCARCHDHKFDPIPTDDYYALAGIFKSTRTMARIVDKRGKGNGIWLEQDVPLDPAAMIDWEIARDRHALQVQQLEDRLPKLIVNAINTEEKKRPDPQKLAIAAFREADPKQDRLLNDLMDLRKSAPKKPPVGRAMSVTDGKIVDLRVMLRGSHLDQGDLVPRRFPQVLAPDIAAIANNRSGRLELAQWLTSPQNPLTARVFVNRVWQWHFGRGLVKTPDNFGYLNDPPTHPQLLDWLADEFRSTGWSLKRLHRLLLCSATYRLSTRHDPWAAEVDPQNQLLWRFRRRRLDAEEVRDSLLAVAGTLDRTMHGSLLSLEPRQYVNDSQSGRHLVGYDNRRRSIYQPIIRNKVYDLFQTFDFPNPSLVNGRRNSTTVSPQVLLLMNSPLAIGSAQQLAARVVGPPNLDDADRLDHLYMIAMCRRPNSEERRSLLAYLDDYTRGLSADAAEERRRAAWNSLSQAVLMLNEFLYVD